MRNPRRIVFPIILVLGTVLLIGRYGFSLRPPGADVATPAAAQQGATLYSGVIQTDEVHVSAEYGGRVVEVLAEEGDPVHAGQPLVRLDTTLIDDQIAVAEANLAVAQASLARLQAGSRPGTVAVAKAQQVQAEAARAAAQQALSDAQALRNNPQELALQVAVAQAQLPAAEARVQQAAAQRDEAQLAVDGLQYARNVIDNWHYPIKKPSLPLKTQEAPYDLWDAWANLNAMTAARDGARDSLAQLQAQLAAPQTLIANVDAAAGALKQAEAGVELARSQVSALLAGPTADQLAAAQAKVSQAAAALDALRVQRGRMEITSPITGTVLVRQIEPGEIAAPGATLLSLGSLQEVSLNLYVPEKDLGQVHVGQGVRVSVDSFPGRVFLGTVKRIADQAEYTPRNVATQDERVNTLYEVEVRLPNPDGALKPGMPADATLEEAPQ